MARRFNDDDDGGALDPLKTARRELVLRQIRNEDLKMAVAEGQLMRTDVHREVMSEIISTMITFLDTLPDVMERKLALNSTVVVAMRDLVDNARDGLHEKLMAVVPPDSSKQEPGQLNSAPPLPAGAAPAKRRPGRPTNAERAMRGGI
jgi:hypothetical protein